jgi:hypothetical protein
MYLRIQRTVGTVNWWRGPLMTVAAKVVPLRELVRWKKTKEEVCEREEVGMRVAARVTL